MNVFIIEEESQFECDGVFDLEDTPSKRYNPLLRRLHAEKSDQNLQMHLILASHRHMPILQNFYEVPKENLMVTCIGSERLECVNGEICDKLNKEGGFIKYQQQSRFRSVEVETSIGDDIEIFVNLIKLKQYAQEIDNTFFRYFPHIISPEWFANAVNTFHIALFDEEQRNRKRLVFKHKTRTVTSENNFALSICFRRTSSRLGGTYETTLDMDARSIDSGRIPSRDKKLFQNEKVNPI